MPIPPPPLVQSLNAAFTPDKINQTKEDFLNKLGDKYELGQIADIVLGIQQADAKNWHKHLQRDLPKSLSSALRQVVMCALVGESEPIPIKFTWQNGDTLEARISESTDEDGNRQINIEMLGPAA